MKIQLVINKIAAEIVKFQQAKQQQIAKTGPTFPIPAPNTDKLDINA